MGLERNCPLNLDRFCRFLFSYVSPSPYPFCFITRTIFRSSNLAVGSQTSTEGKRGMSKRFPRVSTICLSRGADRNGRNSGKGTSFALSCQTGFFSIPFGDLTRPRNKSALRRECDPSVLVFFHRVHFVSLPPFLFGDTETFVTRIIDARELKIFWLFCWNGIVAFFLEKWIKLITK